MLDPGGFGTVTITKSIKIRADGVEAGVLASGLNGIVLSSVLASTDRVVLEGLDIDGAGTGLNGVNILGGGQIYINRCTIRHFTQNGVNMASNTNTAHAFINDCQIEFNAGGVNVQNNTNIASLTNCKVLANTNYATQVNNAILGLQSCVLNASPIGINVLNGGQAISVGPSNLVTGAGSVTSTIPYQ